MLPQVLAMRYLGAYSVWLRFSNGDEGTVDLAGELTGPIFEPLQDVGAFSQVRLHPELKTLVWPNGADLAPEFLRARLRVVA